MAISNMFSDPYGMDYLKGEHERQMHRYRDEQMRAMQQDNLAQLSMAGLQNTAMPPITKPEPNPVLLLLE